MDNLEEGRIEIYGAREHNLKDVDVSIPRNSLTVITGLSGSGKSSLAFDTLYAEGQRRYMETFSAYARQFMGGFERPDVDKIEGLSPVISIEQKTTNKNPRSTVGTITEIYDFLRLLFARASTAYSYNTGAPMVKYGDEKIVELIGDDFSGSRVILLAPVVKGRKGHYKELFERLRKKGFLHVRVDGVLTELLRDMRVDRYKVHDIEIVVDKLTVDVKDIRRIKNSVEVAMKNGDGVMAVLNPDTGNIRYYSRKLMCPDTGISYKDPAPHSFSFNSPHGACPKCKGLGIVSIADIEKIIPDMSLSIRKGAIQPLGPYKNNMFFWQIETVLKLKGFDLDTPVGELPEEVLSDVLYGYPGYIRLENDSIGVSSGNLYQYEGIVKFVVEQSGNASSGKARKWAEQFISVKECDLCGGQRLNREALNFRIGVYNISELAEMELSDLYEWCGKADGDMDGVRKIVAGEILKELRVRLKFLIDVGLGYLSLNRGSATLSGGESQRIRLATQIGSELVNVVYILDEPSIGLHQKDNRLLIRSLLELRDSGNTVIVVEHDREIMEHADYIVDMGPMAGRHGGEVVASGDYATVCKSDTLTAAYLSGRKSIPLPACRRPGNGNFIVLKGCRGNNLKNVDAVLPLGCFVCVTGVSGSGKSTLINDTLYPVLSSRLHASLATPLPYDAIEGLEYVDKVIVVDQQPIGRSPRSNPATYTGVFDDIRKFFEQLPEAKIRGYAAGRFSFNVPGGRCEACKGVGVKTIEMNFLPDVYVPCDICGGKRYNKETLEVRYRGKSIGDVLDMTVNRASEFFENISFIRNKLEVIRSVGLGYVKLGQQSTTLSGGESQRIKLAAELSRKDTGRTLYILDEPTTGLHFEDIRILLDVLNKLVERGNTVVVIEHNPDVIKSADYIIDMGPEGGKNGGCILSCGTPEEVAASDRGYTPRFLREELKAASR